MSTTATARPRDCLPCRLVGSAGLIGIGGYLANNACKNQTVIGKYTLSMFSFAFICLGVARYKQTFPFAKREEQKA